MTLLGREVKTAEKEMMARTMDAVAAKAAEAKAVPRAARVTRVHLQRPNPRKRRSHLSHASLTGRT